MAPDGNAGRDVYLVLYEAIDKAGRVALSRVVIAQRERTIELRPMDGGPSRGIVTLTWRRPREGEDRCIVPGHAAFRVHVSWCQTLTACDQISR